VRTGLRVAARVRGGYDLEMVKGVMSGKNRRQRNATFIASEVHHGNP